MNVRFTAALAGVAVFLSAAAGSAQTTMAPTPGPVIAPTAAPPTGPLALGARSLRGARTSAGFRLTGQALVKDACSAARFAQFLGNIFPPQFDVRQFRRPGTLGLLCAPHPTWVTIQPINVNSAAPPRYVSVRTTKGITRVPILPRPAS